ncbi:MAG: Helix-turn-helix domain [Frankiales bacterium]|nr:Helix-turn-helix domain [Frankiales bacterium]
MTSDRLLILEEVCAIVRLSPEAVRRAVRHGDLRASKLGGRLRFRPADVEAYIDAATIVPVAKPPRQYGQIRAAAAPVSGRPGVVGTTFRDLAKAARRREVENRP